MLDETENFEYADRKYAAELAMHWRIRALDQAVNLHKGAGYTPTADEVVASAKVFEHFLKESIA